MMVLDAMPPEGLVITLLRLSLLHSPFHFHAEVPQVLLNGSTILFCVKAQNVYVVPHDKS